MKKALYVCILLIMVITIVPLSASGQGTPSIGPPPQVMELVARAKSLVRLVTIEDVKGMIDRKEKVFILDVRDPWEYAAGHLPGAVNVSRGTLEFKIWDRIPETNANIVVYCQSIGRAALASRTLKELGYVNVTLLDAPFPDWTQSGYPLER